MGRYSPTIRRGSLSLWQACWEKVPRDKTLNSLMATGHIIEIISPACIRLSAMKNAPFRKVFNRRKMSLMSNPGCEVSG